MASEKNIRPKVCLYHADCWDGVASAWVVLLAHPDVELIAMDYHDPIPPQVEGADVFMVDFCYSDVDLMIELMRRCYSLTLIDHHEFTGHKRAALTRTSAEFDVPFRMVFDTTRSGALLTWDTLFPTLSPPALIQHVSDRDLWLFKMDRTRQVMFAVDSLGLDPRVWKSRLQTYYRPEDYIIDDHGFYTEFGHQGQVIADYVDHAIMRVVQQTRRMVCVFDSVVPMINVSRSMASEALSIAAEGYPFAIGYYDNETHRVFSLRSRRDSTVRLNDLASQYGGGGHPNAAGFKVKRDHPLAQL